jgi:hypothetical protein
MRVRAPTGQLSADIGQSERVTPQLAGDALNALGIRAARHATHSSADERAFDPMHEPSVACMVIGAGRGMPQIPAAPLRESSPAGPTGHLCFGTGVPDEVSLAICLAARCCTGLAQTPTCVVPPRGQ